MLKRFFVYISILALVLFSGCTNTQNTAPLVATTGPVYAFATRLCQGTDLQVSQLVTENVSCLHDYTLKTSQMQMIENAQLVLINGAGLEDFLSDALHASHNIVDASAGLSTLENHHHEHGHGHVHQEDPHIWLSPENAKIMVSNIANGLSARYPEHQATFTQNKELLIAELEALQAYGEEKLSDLTCRKLITFHDGFSYLAESFDLEIIRAIEEESGAEASAAELIELINLIRKNELPAIFTETNGSLSAASVICAETGVKSYALDMGMSGSDYFDSMYHNIDTLWEALQ